MKHSLALSLIAAFAATAFFFSLPLAEAQHGDGPPAPATAQASSDQSLAEAYCVSKGGEVVVRRPYYNTNDDNEQDWLALSSPREFCKFTSKKDGSRIQLLLSTLYTDQPTLATLAYYAKVAMGGSCTGNPASCYCSQLGGTDLFGGVNLNGGGWVQKSDPVDTVLEACIFPDLSSIDSWGLAYHSAGIIRGKDLSKVLRYKDPYTDK
jgi:putative hemolysin